MSAPRRSALQRNRRRERRDAANRVCCRVALAVATGYMLVIWAAPTRLRPSTTMGSSPSRCSGLGLPAVIRVSPRPPVRPTACGNVWGIAQVVVRRCPPVQGKVRTRPHSTTTSATSVQVPLLSAGLIRQNGRPAHQPLSGSLRSVHNTGNVAGSGQGVIRIRSRVTMQ